jgi:hypothetical protein
VPEFLGSLNEVQKRILSNAVRHELLLRYFFASVSTEQMRQFEGYVVSARSGEAEQEEMLHDLAQKMPFALKAAKVESEAALVRVLDYKGEMCAVVDNINDVEVFRCIDVDMPDNYISNLQVNQIQRLMKLKSELQGASPDLREIQLTLKRFILDLDVKEAYEFSILNPFLINEEALDHLVQDLQQAAANLEGFDSNEQPEGLDLQESEEESDD